MCGVVGYLRHAASDETTALDALLAGVRSRGPDDEGATLIDRSRRRIVPLSTRSSRPAIQARLPDVRATPVRHDVALGHARYAIIDVSDEAHQPFLGARGDVVGLLNGEIYNHVELRRELVGAGVACRTTSDTEVLVEGFRLWGDALWPRLNGFWAAVLYDARDGVVTISRDRMGVAPLYYRETAAGLYFASRITPLLDVAPANRARDTAAVQDFVVLGMKDFGPGTCFRDVKSFPPASVLRFAPGVSHLAAASSRTFWELPSTRWRPSDLSLDDAAQGLRERLVRAVELRLRADLPVAFELSGGLDSSSVAAATRLLGRSIATYTVRVPERDELPFARAVAAQLGATQQELPAADDALVAALETFGDVMEEPYHSPNVFTSFRMRQRIKDDGFAVVISGAGGDELLGGYEYEFWDAARAALWRDGEYWHLLRHQWGHSAGSWHRVRHAARDAVGALRRRLANVVPTRGDGPRNTGTEAERLRRGYAARSFHERVRFHFEVAHLPYYLRNGDHLTMAIPLEHRFPFLDVDLVEFGARLPVGYLYRAGWSKYVLRHAMRDLLPPSVVWRREKMGFPFPFTRFLSRHAEQLRPLADEAVTEVLGGRRVPRYDELVAHDPLLLWRLCSTGQWLRATA